MRKLDILYRKNKRNNVWGGIFVRTVILQISMRYDNDNVMNEKNKLLMLAGVLRLLKSVGDVIFTFCLFRYKQIKKSYFVKLMSFIRS